MSKDGEKSKDWRSPGVNHLAMAHALGKYKWVVQMRLSADLIEWMDSEAKDLGISRPAFFGFAMEAVRGAVTDGRVDIATPIRAMSAAYRRAVMYEDFETAREAARVAAGLPPDEELKKAMGSGVRARKSRRENVPD